MSAELNRQKFQRLFEYVQKIRKHRYEKLLEKRNITTLDENLIHEAIAFSNEITPEQEDVDKYLIHDIDYYDSNEFQDIMIQLMEVIQQELNDDWCKEYEDSIEVEEVIQYEHEDFFNDENAIICMFCKKLYMQVDESKMIVSCICSPTIFVDYRRYNSLEQFKSILGCLFEKHSQQCSSNNMNNLFITFHNDNLICLCKQCGFNEII